MVEHKTHLKIHIQELKAMRKSGLKNWGIKQRTWIRKEVFGRDFYYPEMDVKILSTDQNIIRFIAEDLYRGKWMVKGYSKGKTRTHVKLVLLCKVIINHTDPPSGIVSQKRRLSRYWFRKITKEDEQQWNTDGRD